MLLQSLVLSMEVTCFLHKLILPPLFGHTDNGFVWFLFKRVVGCSYWFLCFFSLHPGRLRWRICIIALIRNQYLSRQWIDLSTITFGLYEAGNP